MDPKESSPKKEDVNDDTRTKQERVRQIAEQHAQDIESKKSVQNRVLDLILEAYDLPSNKDADPTEPAARDLAKFRECLSLFRPSDLDELVSERNIDERCGYTLCGKPPHKQFSAGKVWSNKSGTLVDRKTPTQYCSQECGVRNNFVRSQLSTEPAWTRIEKPQEISLLDVAPVMTLSPLQETTADGQPHQNALDDEMTTLYSKRDKPIEIVEKEAVMITKPPSLTTSEVLEGLPMRARQR